jgi:predicted Zn-dependent peptidase
VAEVLAETETFTRDGPTDDEVEAARDYIAGVFPLRMETTAQLASHLAESLVFDLPDDHQARFRDHVRAVTTDAAHEAVSRHIRPQELTVVVVAHRLSTVRRCAAILLLDDGRPVGWGSFDELARSNPRFAHWCALK